MIERANDDVPAGLADTAARLLVDAGVEHVRLRAIDPHGSVILDRVVANHGDLRRVFEDEGVAGVFGAGDDARIVITGRLGATARRALGGGRTVLPAAALWLAAKDLVARPENLGVTKLALVDLSASGFLLVGVDRDGSLVDDLLVVNPRCGAGSGINLDRVLQKLGIAREQVDGLLAAYAGGEGRERRAGVSTRADRCGVFASSATVSDKNQGIPLAVALATTLKSEVLKTCRKLPPGFDKAYLSGRIFRWRFARECAEDFLRDEGVRDVVFDTENTHVLDSLRGLGTGGGSGDGAETGRAASVEAHPSFGEIRRRHEQTGHYLRLPSPPVAAADLRGRAVVVGLDVGSTMAKAVIADAADGEVLALSAYSNAGDTIETVKCVLRDLQRAGVDRLRVRGIGVTGSARYQVQQALMRIHPHAADRVSVLVENYAHARGSIDEARRHVERLKARGVRVNEDFCILVDIGGEDTKVSTIALRRAELFANAMNQKCSAGTGSLMDTLSALFGLSGVASACAEAYAAPRSLAINATCAVFLMENARKLQAEGVPRDQILASANWAIVENMARTLWEQIELPRDAVVLLHGQTMLSDPLPLAVTDRLQSYIGGDAYGLVPPNPGHRACLGLVRTMVQAAPPGDAEIVLADFVGARFEKRIIQCHGAACGDDAARCNRTSLGCRGADGARFSFTLGGCTAINELFSRKGAAPEKPPRDAYKEIWDLIASRQPRSGDPRRVVIPRSFCVTEWAYLLARVLERFGIPVHVDDVRESDLVGAQSAFHIDMCAPQMGAVGQYRRLAGEPHGIILAPQIESLPTDGKSRGHTCTVNQGGVAVARNLAGLVHADARFHLFNLRIDRLDAAAIADQVAVGLAAVFAHYGVAPSDGELRAAVSAAIDDHLALRREAADLAADLAEEAIAEGRQVALVAGREYVLNPGIYDSSVRRLLRDKRMAAIPTYVLDVDLDDDFRKIYWKNPHVIVTILRAVAERTLHRRVKHARLAAVFRSIEDRDPPGPLLPVIQVSTFSCGPDSITSHLIAELMARRPFLLLQSDAVLKELAHLENRVNTYVKQLELGLHGELRVGDGAPLEVRRVDRLLSHEPIDRERDVLYFPTMSDNRCVTSVMRGAGFTCVDNWDDSFSLRDVVRNGRRFTGDSVCTPLAAVYGDMLRAVDDFVRRHARGDPAVAGKRRMLYFDDQGSGPCREGLYVEVHKLLAHREFGATQSAAGEPGAPLPGGAMMRFLVGDEDADYDIGIEEWTFFRCYQGIVVQAILHGFHFTGGVLCRDEAEYGRFLADLGALKSELYAALERFSGPGPAARRWLRAVGERPAVGTAVKYFAYRIHGRDLLGPIARFARRWIRGRPPAPGALRIVVSGETYMRVAQAEEIFRGLLSVVGFRRFTLEASPLWSYLDSVPEERVERALHDLRFLRARRRRSTGDEARACDAEIRAARERLRRARKLGFMLRSLVARPLYRAAGLHLPPPNRQFLEAARELIPTLRPYGEIASYVGEALSELREGADVIFAVAPAGCMVMSMGEVMTPRIERAAGDVRGRIQALFSAEGDVDREVLSLALLKALGPERFSSSRGARIDACAHELVPA